MLMHVILIQVFFLVHIVKGFWYFRLIMAKTFQLAKGMVF